MSNQLRQMFRQAVAGALAAGVAVAAAGPASAQTPATSQATPARPVPTFINAQAAGQAAAQAAGANLQISMEQAVQMAMEANLGLKSARLDIDAAAQSLAAARASFLPRPSSSISRNTTSQPQQQNADGTVINPSTNRINGGAQLQQVLPWFGTNYTVNWSASRFEAPGSRSATFNPSLGSTFSFNVSQPLLSGFLIDQTRFNIRANERQQVITDLQVQQAMVQTEASVRSAYLNLVAAREQLSVSQANLQLVQDALNNTRARVQVGVAPETDILANEVDVATSRVSVIRAEASIAQAEDALRRLILDPARADYWQVSLTPTDTIELTPREIDVDQAIRDALANRIDLTIARRNLEVTDLGLRVSRNATLPNLTAQVNYQATGSGGRGGNGVDRGFGTVLGEAFGGDYPSWTTGVTFSYPIGRTALEASLARAEIQRQQETMNLRESELFVVQQVRDAARQVQNQSRQVEAARAALRASEQNLEAERQRFAVGLSTNLELQIRQQSLASARLSELSAIISYNQALINFDRVMKIR